MNIFANILEGIEPYLGIINLIITVVIASLIFTIILKLIKRYLLKKIKRKKQISNVVVFLDLLKFLFILFLIVIAFSAYYSRWGELGFIVGLLTVALGWALQKPISGVVAWLVIITRRPFFIGDRIVISDIKGDILNITLTHIFLDEVGGTILGEEKSRRTIMIPTSIIFEEEVINYTHSDNYILDEVTMMITYESNLQKAEKIMKNSVSKTIKPYWKKFPKKIPQEPHIRLKSKESGVDVTVRYYTIATNRNAIATDIIREGLSQIRKSDDVEIAYPHTQILLPENKQIK